MQPWQLFESFQPPAVTEAIVLGGLARCKMLASGREELEWALADYRTQLSVQARCPEQVIDRLLKQKMVHKRSRK